MAATNADLALEPPNLLKAQPVVKVYLTSRPDLSAEETTFVIHKNFICHYSAFFDAAFNGNFEESKSQSMSFNDIEPDVFAIVVDWLYRKEVKLPRIQTSNGGRFDCGKLAQAWALGERFLMREMQNKIMDALFYASKYAMSWIGFAELMKIADEHGSTSPMAKFALAMIVFGDTSFFRMIMDDIPPNLNIHIMSLMKVSLGSSYRPELRDLNSLEFHYKGDVA